MVSPTEGPQRDSYEKGLEVSERIYKRGADSSVRLEQFIPLSFPPYLFMFSSMAQQATDRSSLALAPLASLSGQYPHFHDQTFSTVTGTSHRSDLGPGTSWRLEDRDYASVSVLYHLVYIIYMQCPFRILKVCLCHLSILAEHILTTFVHARR